MHAAKALIYCAKRYWELPEYERDEYGNPAPIFGGQSRTDRGTMQSWYPSDNAISLDAADADELSLAHGILLGDEDDRDIGSRQSRSWKAKNPEVSQNPGVFLAAYMYGPSAQHFGSLSNIEREAFVVQCVSRYHPWLRNANHILDMKCYSWDDESSPGGGGWVFFAPNEHARYQAALTEPLPAGENARIFFAGEYVGVMHAWLQSAMQSGVAAARRVP